MAKNDIKEIDNRILEINDQILMLRAEKESLQLQKEKLQEKCSLEKSQKLAEKDWSGSGFSWSKKLQEVLESKFKIKNMRPLQLEAINATMSNEDTILIMPTGGGKSLCYQLPAFLSPGVTLVISPLVALMEDQVHNLKKLGIDAIALSASSSKEEIKKATDALQNSKSTTRLLYVTPERLAKSKRFMNQLQKCAAEGRFARLAIDEVHCCSTWGHDFRPDYNFLGVLKDMFPKVPILGLTATSSSKVTLDVQKMLNVEGCLVLRAPLNRPNLFYSVVQKPNTIDKCIDWISTWIHNQCQDQCGIVYATTIKDCESVARGLKSSEIKTGIYHANLEPKMRTKMYEKWVSGKIHVIVATIAFGLGINKPDVRFVIHLSISKSLEMLYQESGRAGRDGLPANCIVMYELEDVIKLSTMVFTQRTGLENLRGVVQFCLNPNKCRRKLFAEYFDEAWDAADCKRMCDHCLWERKGLKKEDAADICRALYRLFDRSEAQSKKLTAKMILKEWPTISNDRIYKFPAGKETVLALLMCLGYLKEDFHYTAYSTICYLKKGPKAALLDHCDHKIMIEFAVLPPKFSATTNDPRAGTEPGLDEPVAKKRKFSPEVVEIT